MSKLTIIFAIVGSSGSGKSTMADTFMEHGIPSVISYTTRSMRPGERSGVGHYFIDDLQADELLNDKSSVAAYTYFGGHRYFTLWNNILAYNICAYVIDEDGLIKLRETKPSNVIIHTIYIRRSEEERIASGVDRERILRDAYRKHLPMSEYNIIIDNDAPSAEVFVRFSTWLADMILNTLSNLTSFPPLTFSSSLVPNHG